MKGSTEVQAKVEKINETAEVKKEGFVEKIKKHKKAIAIAAGVATAGLVIGAIVLKNKPAVDAVVEAAIDNAPEVAETVVEAAV